MSETAGPANTAREAGFMTCARHRVLAFVPALVAMGIWSLALASFDTSRLRVMSDLGLVSVLPAGYFLALAILIAGFAHLVSRPEPRTAPAVGHVLALVAVLHATPAILYATPRYPFTYKHIGVADLLGRVGSIDRGIDAYFNWPGFFGIGALASDLAGLDTVFGLAIWGPVAMNALIVLGLGSLVLALDGDRRLAWLAVWFFLLANWIGQDYFAPQALAFALHLAVLGGYLSWFVRRQLGSLWTRTELGAGAALEDSPASDPGHLLSAGQRAAVLAALVLVFFAIVASHQLTPFVTLGSVAVLVLLGLGRAWMLPVVMAASVLGWFTYVSVPYLVGHLPSLLANVGRVLENIASAGAILSTPGEAELAGERTFVLFVRQAMTLLMAALALGGGVRRLRHGVFDAAALVLALVPIPLIVLQPYGGEMILRIYMFALPMLAWFAAALFFPQRRSGRGPATVLFVAIVSGGLAAGSMFSYYGNEGTNYVAPDEILALERLYEVAPDGALVVTTTSNAPIRHARYADVAYVHLGELAPFRDAMAAYGSGAVVEELASSLRGILRRDNRPTAFVLLLRSERATARLFGEFPESDLLTLERAIDSSPAFDAIFESTDAAVFQLSAAPRGMP